MVQHSSIDHTGLTGVSTVSYASNVNRVDLANYGGAASTVTRGDHVHLGVTSLSHTSNTFSGPVTLVAAGTLGITSPSTGTFTLSASAAAGGGSSDLAGKELDYVQITAPVNITATTEGTADTVVTAGAIAYDGATIVILEFFSPGGEIPNTANTNLIFCLYDGASSIGFWGQETNANTASVTRRDVHLLRRLTPSAATHTYSVRAFVGAGTGVVIAGAGGAAAYVPAFIRTTRVA